MIESGAPFNSENIEKVTLGCSKGDKSSQAMFINWIKTQNMHYLHPMFLYARHKIKNSNELGNLAWEALKLVHQLPKETTEITDLDHIISQLIVLIALNQSYSLSGAVKLAFPKNDLDYRYRIFEIILSLRTNIHATNIT